MQGVEAIEIVHVQRGALGQVSMRRHRPQTSTSYFQRGIGGCSRSPGCRARTGKAPGGRARTSSRQQGASALAIWTDCLGDFLQAQHALFQIDPDPVLAQELVADDPAELKAEQGARR